MPAIRTFIALPTQHNIQQAMAEIQAKLKEAQADVKWDLPDKFHITLKFLGSVEPSKLELLSSTLAICARQFTSFGITYESLGVFPSYNNPRVMWLGAKFNHTMFILQSAVERVCLEFGFPKEYRIFRPHITFGRVKGTRNLVRLTEAIKTVTFESIESRCSEVLLMKSDLLWNGSIYTILKSFPLQPCNAG